MYKENKDITLQYYNQNAGSFVSGTVHADLTDTLNRFLSRLEPGAAILDFGCGSGRDTKYFLEHGYQVEAIDGSEELCKIASAYTGIPVRQMYFQDLDVREQYDGYLGVFFDSASGTNRIKICAEKNGECPASRWMDLHFFQIWRV